MANAVCDQLDQDFAPPRRWDRDFFNLQWFAELCTTAAFICMTRASTCSEIGCPNWDDSYNSR